MAYDNDITWFWDTRFHSCRSSPPTGKSYPGIMDHEKLFETTKGQSFKCQSKTQLKMAENLTIKLIPLQIQAFDLPKNTFGKGANILHITYIHSLGFFYHVIHSLINHSFIKYSSLFVYTGMAGINVVTGLSPCVFQR